MDGRSIVKESTHLASAALSSAVRIMVSRALHSQTVFAQRNCGAGVPRIADQQIEKIFVSFGYARDRAGQSLAVIKMPAGPATGAFPTMGLMAATFRAPVPAHRGCRAQPESDRCL